MFAAVFIVVFAIALPAMFIYMLWKGVTSKPEDVARNRAAMAAAEQVRIERLAQRNVAIRQAEARLEGKRP